jgi:hypothetical protein
MPVAPIMTDAPGSAKDLFQRTVKEISGFLGVLHHGRSAGHVQHFVKEIRHSSWLLGHIVAADPEPHQRIAHELVRLHSASTLMRCTPASGKRSATRRVRPSLPVHVASTRTGVGATVGGLRTARS